MVMVHQFREKKEQTYMAEYSSIMLMNKYTKYQYINCFQLKNLINAQLEEKTYFLSVICQQSQFFFPFGQGWILERVYFPIEKRIQIKIYEQILIPSTHIFIMNRLTVSDIFNSQNPTTIVSQSYQRIFIASSYIFCICQEPYLDIYELKTFTLKAKCSIPSNLVLDIKILNHTIGFIIEGRKELFIYDLLTQQLKECFGHISPIRCICDYGSYFATGGSDYTIRLWQMGDKIHPYAMTGHTQKLTCFSTYKNFLISGSSDKTLKLWVKKDLFSSTNFDDEVIKICPCYETSQIIVFTRDGTLSFIPMTNLAKKKPVEVRRRLETQERCLSCCQIDDSFLVYSNGKSLVYVELNETYIIKENEVEGEVEEVKSIGRMLVCGNKQKGIQLIKL